MLPLAMAYMPFQYWQKIYDPQAGFKRGTIFEELDLPYIGRDK
ncbi:MAG: spore coat associated protein CotJA [Oscillospiraceae bacterium]|nr:spore coat associated protein CotJA [Oscillospiraceae bacterium]